MNKDNLTQETINLLESYRDYNSEIDELEGRLYDLESELDSAIDFDDKEEIAELQSQIDELNNQIDLIVAQQKQEYMQEIKDLPGPTNKTSFEGFRIDITEPPYWGYMIPGQPDREYYMNKEGYTDTYIAEMTPEEYLLLCGKYAWQARFDNIEDIYNNLTEYSHELIHKYAEQMKQGEKAPLPHLDMKNEGQEGRHRAFAAIEAGIETIPVLILI